MTEQDRIETSPLPSEEPDESSIEDIPDEGPIDGGGSEPTGDGRPPVGSPQR
ncbi:MAG TPA: hypothetical protein VHB47_17085 [Thermoanaerobaculia bacterium]|nr:hypothetical protein [Thermoanaerobaculia bacterium]